MSYQPPPYDFTTVPPPAEHLLPPNATPLERALSASDTRVLLAPTWVIRAVWDPETCPVHLLPYLAAAWSVDEWDPAWSEAEKRAAIVNALWIHQHKGTVGALKRALARLRLAVTVSEWFEHGGAPYTFRLRVALEAGATWTKEQAERMWRVALRTKNVRSYLDAVEVVAPSQAPCIAHVGIAVVARIATRPIIDPVTAIAAPRLRLRTGAFIKVRVGTRSAPIGV